MDVIFSTSSILFYFLGVFTYTANRDKFIERLNLSGQVFLFALMIFRFISFGARGIWLIMLWYYTRWYYPVIVLVAGYLAIALLQLCLGLLLAALFRKRETLAEITSSIIAFVAIPTLGFFMFYCSPWVGR